MITWATWGLCGFLMMLMEHYVFYKIKRKSMVFSDDDVIIMFSTLPLGPIGFVMALGCLYSLWKDHDPFGAYKEQQSW